MPTVVHVIDSLEPSGAEMSLAELLPRYEAAGFHGVVVVLHRSDSWLERRVAAEHDVRFVDAQSLVARVRLIRRVLREERAALLHTTLYDADLAGRLAAIGTKVPVLNSLVNTTYDDARLRHEATPTRKVQLARALDGFGARHLVDAFHAISEAAADDATRRLGVDRSRIVVVPRGRDDARLGAVTDERRSRARAMLDLAPDDEVVVTVGRQDHQKGHVHLLRATELLRSSRPHLRVLVVGRESAATADLAPLFAGLGPHARSLGLRDDVPEVLAAADVFAFPSLWEGQGGALVEALAMGLPVVASDLPVLREVVRDGDSAVLVAPADERALADGIARVLDDAALRATLRHGARQRFEDRFSLDRSAAGMIAMYEGIVR